MAIEALSVEEQGAVLGCMKATAAYLDDWEFPTRLGFEINDLRLLIDRWPNIDDRDENSVGFLAINNCLSEVCHGFQIPPEEWHTWFNVPMATVKDTYRNWLSIKGTSGGIR